jgi:hypothetical protein
VCFLHRIIIKAKKKTVGGLLNGKFVILLGKIDIFALAFILEQQQKSSCNTHSKEL